MSQFLNYFYILQRKILMSHETAQTHSYYRLLGVPFLFSIFFVLLIYILFEPQWETNDDVGISMIAHGYGGSILGGSPKIIFSNILWGYFVRLIPTINGVLGYSIATLGVLIIVGTTVFYTLKRLGVSFWLCSLTLALVLMRPTFFPQFTINAGLLMVGAALCWQVFSKYKDNQLLMLGCILAYCSFLIRAEEFLLILCVSLPLLSWRILLKDKAIKVAGPLLVCAILVSSIFNYQAYKGEEWKSFNDLHLPRAYFTDFGADKVAKKRPDVLKKHGYSINDINLIRTFFFVDPNIANPTKLKAIVNDLGPLPISNNHIASIWKGLKFLWHPNLLPLILTGLLLALIRPNWQVISCWILCLIAVSIMGILGRPGILRVYTPLVSLLLVAPFFNHRASISILQYYFCFTILMIAIIFNTSSVISQSNSFHLSAKKIRQEFLTLPETQIFAWGGTFPFEALYPVLTKKKNTTRYQLYSLGTTTLAPTSISFFEQKRGRGMIDLFIKPEGILLFANNRRYNLLQKYCTERLKGKFKVLFSQKYSHQNFLKRCRCQVNPDLTIKDSTKSYSK